MAIKLSENALLSLLKEKNLKPVVEEKSKQIYLMMRINAFEVPVFIGVRGDGTLLQTIAYFPYEINTKALGDAARLLHMLNREVDVPGFGMDEKQQILFFRCVLPCMDGMLEPRLLDLYLATTRIACETFMEAIGQIASGRTTIDEVMKEKPK